MLIVPSRLRGSLPILSLCGTLSIVQGCSYVFRQFIKMFLEWFKFLNELSENSLASWYNREESHSGQLYHLYKAVLSLCPEYDTSLRYYTTAPLSFEVLLLNTGNKNWLLESYFYKPATTTPYTIITILCILFLFPPFYKRYTHNTQSKPCSILGYPT